MRFWFSIIVLVAIAIGLALFPSVASQTMTIEVVGWHLEMKQGLFLALALLLLVVVKLLLWLIRIVIKGPQHLVAAWRNGGRKRQETRVRNALTAWANGERVASNAFDVSSTLLPTWLAAALAAWVDPGQQDHPHDTPLAAALRGRVLSDSKQPPLALRQQAVTAWRESFPRAPLAQQRALQLAEEEEDWQEALALMDQMPRGVVVADGQARRAKALLHLAQADPATALTRLRQAAKLMDNDDIVLALAAAHRQADDLKSARAVLLDGLDNRDSLTIAKALAAQEEKLDNPLLTLHMLDKRCRKQATVAQRWLLVILSQQAEDNERLHHNLRLLKQMPEGNQLAWHIEANLHMENSDWESAAHCYQQAVTGA